MVEEGARRASSRGTAGARADSHRRVARTGALSFKATRVPRFVVRVDVPCSSGGLGWVFFFWRSSAIGHVRGELMWLDHV